MIGHLHLHHLQFCDSYLWNLQIKIQLLFDCDNIIPGVKRQCLKAMSYELKIQHRDSIMKARLSY